MGKKQTKQEPQDNGFDLSQYLGDDEVETAGENADFGDDPETSFTDDADYSNPDQYDTQGVDEIGGPEKDAEPEGESEDDSADEDSTDTEADADENGEDSQEESDEGEDETATAEDSETEQSETQPEDESRQPKKKDPVIPKRRLDSEVAKRRQVEQELKQLREQYQQTQQQLKEREKVPEEDIQNWLQQSAQKALDGETEESAKLQQKAFDAMASNRGEGQQGEQQQPMDPDELVSQVEERVELKHKVKDVFEAYPALDPNNDQFDETLNEEVVELNDFYTQKGYTGPAAVEKAVEVLAAQHGLKPANAEPEAQPKKPARNTKPKVDQKMDVANKQPSEPTSRRGNKSAPEETVDITQLDDEELMALPENVRARLRGDG